MIWKTLIFIMFIGILTGCSEEGDNITQEEVLNGTWNLKNLRAGFAGLDENYQDGEITWTFNSQNQTLVIDNNVPLSEGFIFSSGTYQYSVNVVNNQDYLIIEGNEYGGLTIATNSLTIDQNNISWGVGADGFILGFEK